MKGNSISGDVVIFDASPLRAFATDVVCKLGAPSDIAAVVANSLVASNLAGHDSHGILLLPYYAELVERSQILPSARARMCYDQGPVVLLDGQFGFGQFAGREGVRIARERATRHGLALVLGRNANHLARLGEYTSMLAESGLIAILLVNCQGSGQLIPPFGGVDRRLTNNPISIAVPGDSHPVLLDMALSVAAEAKVWLAKAREEKLPEGWILDREGRPSTRPEALFEGGTLLPVGGVRHGHKACGLIILVDLLAGALSGGGVCRPDASADFSNAFFLLAVDPAPIVCPASYEQDVATLRDYVKSSRRQEEMNEILFPGEFEDRSRHQRSTGGIPIESGTWKTLCELGSRVGARVPTARKAQSD